MDQESLDKWKQEFQNERREQFNKVKELQKETLQRRKTMEMRIQIEAAKEEKRRKDALAQRRAQHVEATMRYQRGLKNFKANKEKISLEDVLSKISRPSSSRSKNSYTDEDKVVVYNKELANMFRDPTNKTNLNHRLKKSSSFDNLTNLTPYNYSTPIKQTNINKTPDKNMSFNDILIENQKTLQEYNKEALKNFQNMIRSEVKNQQNNIYILQQENKNNPNTNHLDESKLKVNNMKSNYFDANSDIISIDDNQMNGNLSDSDSIDTDSLSNTNTKLDISNDAIHKDTFTDVNRNMTIKLDNKNESNYQIETNNSNNSYFNLVSRNVNNSANTNTNLNKNRDSNIRFANSNSAFNNYTIGNINTDTDNINTFNKKNHFFNSNNPSEKKSTENLNSEHAHAILTKLKLSSNALNNAVNNNTQLNSTLCSNNETKISDKNYNSNSKQIKSILKRSSSFDNSFSNIGVLSPMVNFGIKLHSGVKDSVELANNRIGSAQSAKLANDSNLNGGKKSVRFASQPLKYSNNLQQNNNFLKLDLQSLNSNMNQVHHQPTEQEKLESMKQNEVHASNLQYSRISSANSIRRSIVRPKNNTINNKQLEKSNINELSAQSIASPKNNHTDENKIQKETLVVLDEKPPAYPSANTLLIGNVSSYALLSQKRKDIIKNSKINSDRSLNSPKATSLNNMLSPSQQQQQQSYSQKSSLEQSQQNQAKNNQIHVVSNYVLNENLSNVNNNQSKNLYNNIRYNEINFREYQAARLNNDLNTNAATPTTISIMNQNATKFRLNNTDPNLFRRNSNGSNNNNGQDGYHSSASNVNQPIETYTLTRIPLSPKSNLKANYYFSPNVQNFNGSGTKNGSEANSFRRPPNSSEAIPSSTITTTTTTKYMINSPNTSNVNGPNTTTITNQNQNVTGYTIPKTNIRFAYMNPTSTLTTPNNEIITNNNFQNNIVNQNLIGQRAFSADNLNQNSRINNPSNNFEVKYPLYSNYQAQYVNITKASINGANFQNKSERSDHVKIDVGSSMAAFLKAEELSAKECSESQIINAVKEMNNNKVPKTEDITSLSIEEQNVKNSIMRLNERLKKLKNDNNQRRYNQVETNINSTIMYDNNRQIKTNARPFSCNILQGRR